MVKIKKILIHSFCGLLAVQSVVFQSIGQTSENKAQEFDFSNFDPFAVEALSDSNDEALDEMKSADQLITEADYLLEDQRPLDGRTKLMRALKKDPSFLCMGVSRFES